MDEIPKLSVQQKYEGARAQIFALYNIIGALAKRIYEKLKDEGLNIISDVMRSFGTEASKTIKSQVKGEDPKSIGVWFITLLEVLGIKYELSELTENEVRIKVLVCPYAPYIANKPELCNSLMTLEKTLVKEVAPKVKFEYPKTIAAGDPHCELIFSW